MMKTNERILKEIDLMSKSGAYVTVDEMSKSFGVSKATIRLDINEIRDSLKKYEIELDVKRGTGFKLKGSSQNILKLKQALSKGDNSLDEISKQALIYLIKNINKYTMIKDISQELSISESSISKRLKPINVFLKKYNSEILSIKNKGIVLTGKENGLRKLLIDYTINLVPEEPLQKKDDTATQILNVLKIDSSEIFKAIEEAQKFLKIKLSDESFNTLAIHIAIAIERIRKGQTATVPLQSDKDKFREEYDAALLIANHIDKAYAIEMDENEIYYLFLHLMSTHILRSDTIASPDENDIKANKICNSIIQLIENIKQVTIEQKYINNLLLHLHPMINRLEYGMELKNPLLDEIKAKYPESYGIAWMCNQIFIRECHKPISENEAGYLSIHIQTMLESIQTKINAVVVCSSGIGISQLLATQISQNFRNINIIDVCGLDQFKRAKYENLHLVISSMNIETTYPLIVVSPILNAQNINELSDFLSEYKFENINKLEIFGRLKRKFKDKKELIDFVGKDLESKGIVTNEFIGSVLQREKISSTEIGMGIAIPHAEFSTILKPLFYIVTLIEPIKWNDEGVDLIVFPLVNEASKLWEIPQLNQIYKKLLIKQIRDDIVKEDDIRKIERMLR